MRISMQTNHRTEHVMASAQRRASTPADVVKQEAMRVVGLQHEEVVRMIATFFGSVASVAGYDVVKGQLERMGDYIEEHFESEEDMLLRCLDEHYDSHKREHDYFRGRFRNLKHEFLYDFANSARASVELYHLLTDWLRDHMKVNDHGLGACHTKNGGVAYSLGRLTEAVPVA